MSESQIEVRITSTADALEGLRPFWTRVNRHPESDLDFVQMLAGVRPEIVRLHVLVAYDLGQPVALMIGRLEQTFVRPRLGYCKLFPVPLRQLVFVRDGLVGEQSERVAAAMAQAVAGALKEGVAERVLLCSLPAQEPLLRWAGKCAAPWQRDYAQQPVQHWRTRLPDTFEAFLSKRPKKHRYWLRRISRVLETEFAGRVRHSAFREPEEVAAFCTAAEAVARKTYQRGLGVGFADNPENRQRLALAARKGWFRGYVTFLENRPVAFWAGERVGEVMYLAWTGFDPAHRQHEVGTVLFLKMLEDLLAEGAKEIDYGLGWAQYKERFGDLCLQEQDVALYAPTAKGWGLNLLRTLEAFINQAGKRILAWTKLREKFKRSWRSELAGKGNPVEPAAKKQSTRLAEEAVK